MNRNDLFYGTWMNSMPFFLFLFPVSSIEIQLRYLRLQKLFLPLHLFIENTLAILKYFYSI